MLLSVLLDILLASALFLCGQRCDKSFARGRSRGGGRGREGGRYAYTQERTRRYRDSTEKEKGTLIRPIQDETLPRVVTSEDDD